tara:strand:+ start:4371 stop:5840 length:1470 start_codon:yes stop_codon:yes gene_type:complete
LVNFKEKLIQGFAWQASTKLLVQILSWISTIWVARILTPEDYGLVALAGMVTGIFVLLASSGLAAGLVNRTNVVKEELDTMFWLSLLAGVFFYFSIFITAGSVSDFYDEPELANLIKFQGLFVVIASIKIVPSVCALREFDYKFISLTDMVGGLTVIVITLSMAIMGYEYWSLVVGTVIAELIMTIIYFLKYRYLPLLVLQYAKVKDVFRFGLTLFSSRGVSYISMYLPVFLISNYSNVQVTGHYKMAHTLAHLPSSKVGSLFQNLIFPTMSRIKENKELSRNTFIQMHTSLLFVTGPMFLGLALLAESIVVLLLTEKWLPIVFPFQVLCVIAILRLSAKFITGALEGLALANVSLQYQILTVLVCGPSMLIGLLIGDLNMMLLFWALSTPVAYLFLLNKIAKELAIAWYSILTPIIPLFFSLFLMSLAVFYIHGIYLDTYGEIYKIVFSILVGVVTYSVCLLLFAKQYLVKVLNLAKNSFKPKSKICE